MIITEKNFMNEVKTNYSIKSLICCAICVIFPVIMVIVAQLTGENEIIFSEFAALTTGAWAAPKTPWKTNRLKIVSLLMLASLCGVCLNRYTALPVLAKTIFAFIFTAVCLTAAKSTFVPMISACVLPILMSTDTFIYFVSVTMLALICVTVQYILERLDLREPMLPQKTENTMKNEIYDWLLRTAIFTAAAIYPVISRNYCFIAPPIIVAFVEFSNRESSLRRKPLKILAVIALACFFGEFTRFLCVSYNVSIWVCALLSMTAITTVFLLANTFFPPAGAMALLPLILSNEQAHFYTVKAMIGCVLFISAALLVFRDKKSKENKNLS